jgi:hypothetical protein
MDRVVIEEVSRETIVDLKVFYSKIQELGNSNLLTELNHLAWKHLTNPNGKSILIGKRIDNELVAALILQKNKLNKIKFLLACDFAISKNQRNITNVIEIWNAALTVFSRETDYDSIFNSSNLMSEKIYRIMFKDKKNTEIVPTIILPKLGIFKKSKNWHTKYLSYFNSEKTISDWKWSAESNRQYLSGEYKGTVFFIAKIEKYKFLKVLIILDINLKAVEDNFFGFGSALIRTLIKNRTIIPIVFISSESSRAKISKNIVCIKIPTVFEKIKFPIYIHNKDKDTLDGKHFFLSILDVL